MLLLFLLSFVNAVMLCAQVGSHHPALPWASPPESCQDHICPHPVGPPATPSLALPAWDTHKHTHTHTHTSYLSCVFYLLMFRVAHWLGVLTSGRGGGWFLGGPKAGNAWRVTWGVTMTPSFSRNSCFSPHPRVPPPTPKEVALVYSEDSATVSLFPEI